MRAVCPLPRQHDAGVGVAGGRPGGTPLDGVYLFASATCPNCKIAETLLGKANIAYKKVLAQENVALTESLGIKQAPTLVHVKDGEFTKYTMVANIKEFIKGY